MTIEQILTFSEEELEAHHNLLWISRILKSLVTLGQLELSHCIFVCLNNLALVDMPELQSMVDSHWKAASKS